jgi:ribosome recycling factor
MKAKQQWLKTRAKTLVRKKRPTWERDPETSVRVGWQRWTTYYRKETINYLKKQATKEHVFVMDLLEDIINDYKKRCGATKDTD